ncbi:MAG: hypothetical protein ABIQ36_10600 [Rhodanobacter sp.]
MDDACTQTRIGSTQQLLADRLRQRYARCRESLASLTSETSAPTIEVRAPTRLLVVRGDKAAAPAQAQPSSSAERFSTLFSQAYSAARQEQGASLANTLDRVKHRAQA